MSVIFFNTTAFRFFYLFYIQHFICALPLNLFLCLFHFNIVPFNYVCMCTKLCDQKSKKQTLRENGKQIKARAHNNASLPAYIVVYSKGVCNNGS